LPDNPFKRVPKANTNTDVRKKRRAMTPEELEKMLHVSRWRPLAEFGRERIKTGKAKGKRRATWKKAPLSFENIDEAADRARELLSTSNPEFMDKLLWEGRQRALIYKTFIYTGLRRKELASLTVGQLSLDTTPAILVLDAADEKNREGNNLPVRDDLAADLREWLADMADRTETQNDRLPCDHPLFHVPACLVKRFDKDLAVAGIPKIDQRGRSLDVHALRTTFGTLLSTSGVAPRTAQQAMRHSKLDLTMNVYTDPALLDVAGAVESLPKLNSTPPSA
jgi:integrase